MSQSLERVKKKRVMHPNSLKNLHPFPKGSNGGLNRQGYSLTSRLRDSLNKPIKAPPKDAPARDHIVYSTIEGAKLREPTPFKELWERVDGKVVQPITGEITERRISFVFVLPDGSRLTPGEIIGNRDGRSQDNQLTARPSSDTD